MLDQWAVVNTIMVLGKGLVVNRGMDEDREVEG